MAIYSPEYLARNAVKARLSNSATGFNPYLAAAAPYYPGATAFIIDFTGVDNTFYESQIDIRDVIPTGFNAEQFMCLYAVRSDNDTVGADRLQYHTFSGWVAVMGKLFMQYRNENPKPDFELQADAVSDALIRSLNSPSLQADFSSPGGVGPHYQKFAGVIRQPIQTGGLNWVQEMDFSLSLFVAIP